MQETSFSCATRIMSYTISRFTGFNPVRNFGSQPGYPARRGWGTWKERGPRWSWLGSGVVDASRRAGSMLSMKIRIISMRKR